MKWIHISLLGLVCLLSPGRSLAGQETETKAVAPVSLRALRHAPHIWVATDEILYPILPHGFAFDGLDNDCDGEIDLEDVDEIMWDTGSPAELLKRWNAAKRRGTLPPACIVYSDKADPVKNRHLIEYWSYYLLDMGAGSHSHDGEHTFIFTDTPGLDSKVVAVECGAHTDGSRSNVLITNPFGGNTRVWPALPNHMPILVELGKHASAPDRELDGTYSIYQDGNYGEQDVWGMRDVGASLQVNKINKMKPYYSFERSLGTLITEKTWTKNVMSARLPVDEKWGNEVDSIHIAKLQAAPYRRDPKTYTLFPMEVMKDLVDKLGSDLVTKSEIEEYLRKHQSTLWFNKEANDTENEDYTRKKREPWVLSESAFQYMKTWGTTRDYKLNVWDHPKHLDPEKAFKTHLIPRIAIGGGMEYGEELDLRIHLDLGWSNFPIGGNGVATVDLGFASPHEDLYRDSKFFRDSLHDVRIRFQNYRGRHLGPYVIPFGISKLNESSQRSIIGFGYQAEFGGGAIYTSLIGEQKHLLGKIDDIYWNIGFRFSKTVLSSTHPLLLTSE